MAAAGQVAWWEGLSGMPQLQTFLVVKITLPGLASQAVRKTAMPLDDSKLPRVKSARPRNHTLPVYILQLPGYKTAAILKTDPELPETPTKHKRKTAQNLQGREIVPSSPVQDVVPCRLLRRAEQVDYTL